MKIKIPSEGKGEKWIDDNSAESIKILEGYDFSFDEKNNVVIGKNKITEILDMTKMTNRYQAKIILEKITTLNDFKKFLIKILDLL